MTRSRRTIREELAAELSLEAPDLERVAELNTELDAARRLWRRRRRETAARAQSATKHERAPEPVPDGLTETDAEAIETWPPELRARLTESAFNRVVDRASPVSDPDNWGAKNDLRRRGARP